MLTIQTLLVNASSIHHITFRKYTSRGTGITTNKKKSEWKSHLGCMQLWSVSVWASVSVSVRQPAGSAHLHYSCFYRLLDMRCNTHTFTPSQWFNKFCSVFDTIQTSSRWENVILDIWIKLSRAFRKVLLELSDSAVIRNRSYSQCLTLLLKLQYVIL